MSLVLESIELPIRIRPDRMPTDEELQRFSQENRPMRVELDSTGELIVGWSIPSAGSLKSTVPVRRLRCIRIRPAYRAAGVCVGLSW